MGSALYHMVHIHFLFDTLHISEGGLLLSQHKNEEKEANSK